MNKRKVMAIIEGLLFLNEEPLSIDKIADILKLPPDEVEAIIEEMKGQMEEEQRGLQIMDVGGGYLLGTRAELAEYMDKLFEKEASATLSRAALETLAIIAYRQPITRVEIEAVRGVRVDKILDNLLKRQLIRVVGRKEALGRPLLYGITDNFLKYFGLNSLKDLPPLENMPEEENVDQPGSPG